MNKSIKIVQSPFNPGLEVVEDIVIILHVPYSNKSVTILVNPIIQDYKENADTKNAQVRQVMITTSTNETRVLSFDFENNRKHKINVEGSDYEIELINIGKDNIKGQDFPFFDLM